jgi:hypothetical protein
MIAGTGFPSYRQVPRFARRPSIVGMGDVFSDLAGDLNALADSLGSGVMSIPGVAPLVNGPLKDFASSSVGQIVLPIIANSLGGGIYQMTRFAPAMITVWAMPGVARGDDFDHAMILGVADRLKQTAQILGVDISAEIMSQLQTLMGELIAQYGASVTTALPDIQTIAATYDVRQDVAAIAKAQLEHIQLPDLTDFDLSSGNYYLDQTPETRSLRAPTNEALILAEAKVRGNITSIATATQQATAFEHFTGITTPAPAAAVAKPAAVSAVKAVAPAAAGMSQGEKIAIVAGAGGLLAVLAAVLIK